MKTLLKNLTMIMVLVGMISQLNAADSYTFQDATLKANGKTTKVFLGVPLKIKANKGDSSEVVIKGFMFGDNNVYSTTSKELVIAQVGKGFKVNKKAANAVELVGTIEKELITDNGPEVWEEHEEFYFEMCTQCHAAPSVPHHTMVEWEAIFGTMKGFAKLDEEEGSYLLRYLKSNASNGLIKTKH